MKSKFYLIAIAAGLSILVITSFSFGLFSGLENFLEDLLFSKKPVSGNIIIVAIDNESIQKIGQWPWPRRVFKKALENLKEKPPAAVGIDVIFSEISRYGKDDDDALSVGLNKLNYPVVFPAEAIPLILESNGSVRAGSILKPLDYFLNNKNVSLGHVNLILDADGVVRKFPLRVGDLNAFAYEVIKKSGKIIPEDQFLAEKNINRIVYSAPTGSIRRVSFWRLLEDKGFDLKDKIVLIGATASDLHDEKPTPFSKGNQMSGVEIQANLVNMFISGYRLNPLNKKFAVSWLILAILLSALLFIIFERSLLPIFLNIFFGLIYLIAIAVLFEKGIAVNILHINFAWIFSTLSFGGYRYFSAEKEKREIKNLFSKYVSKDVLNEILSNPTKVKLGGEEKEITVLFSDIRGFTAISEKIAPKELVRILNKYFTAMTNEVLKNNGVLDKYIGDAIMAFWGAPMDDANQAENALKASLGMIEKLKELNKELKSVGDPEINIGIGLYTGPAIVGNVGSDLRFDYTAMGDTVNVASRLEGLNKEYKTQIIIGEIVKNKIKGNYKFNFLGSVAVKGRKEPLNIYTIEI